MAERLFAFPGSLSIDPEVLVQGQAFFDAARAADPDKDWILAFEWADDRRYRIPGTNNWRVMGAGLDVCVYKRRCVPPSVIVSLSGVPLVVKMRADVLSQSKQRRLISDPQNPSNILLR